MEVTSQLIVCKMTKMEIKSVFKNTIAKADEWLFEGNMTKAMQNRHFWIITALMVFCTFLYYVDQTPLANVPPFNHSFFTSTHDALRIFFIIPVIYAALVFRVQGSLIISFSSFCVILPRALLYSPYPDPLFRSLVFVAFAALIGLLLATQLNRIEREKEVNSELNKAYKKLNDYHEKLRESQEQLAQADKLSSLGQLAASIAHEVNNPLSGVLIYTQLITKKITQDKLPKEVALGYLSKMDSELTRSTRLIQNLLDFARQSPPDLRATNVNDVVTRSLDLTTHSAKLQGIEVIKDLEPSLSSIMADFNQIQQVCTNLILNAIQAMPDGGRLILRTLSQDDWLKIELKDTGCGISQENMSKLFTPFFTTKGKAKGVGLGLAVVYGIIQCHKGKIEVQSKEGVGTTFTVCLPMHYEEKD